MKQWTLLLKRELASFFFRKGYVLNILSLFLMLCFLLSLLIPSQEAGKVGIVILLVQLLTTTIFAHHVLEDDFKDSTLDQLKISGYGSTFLITAKLFSYWIFNVSVLTLGTFAYLFLYKIPVEQFYLQFIVLLIMSILSTTISVLSSSLTMRTEQNGLITLLISTPLSIAFLLYAASLLSQTELNSFEEIWLDLKVLTAFCFIIVPTTVFACSYIISEIQCNG